MSSPKNPTKQRSVVPEKELQKKTYAYHAHNAREVMVLFGVDDAGHSDAAVARMREKFGSNTFSEKKEISVFSRVFEQLKSPLVFVLLLAFGITSVLQEYIDAGVILFALTIAIVVGVLQEGKASKAFKKLSDAQIKVATVIRGGSRHEIPAADVVPGDVVFIQNGEQIPADIRLIKTKQLSINEAPLTGEWLPVKKQAEAIAVGTPFAEQINMAWKGTFVAGGQATGVVVAIGDKTAVGKLAQDVQDVVETETPLQHEMKKVSKIMLYIIAALVIALFAIGLWQGMSLHDMLLMSIAIAVASIPEGLPAAVTIILAVGMEALLKRGGLVRNLLAAETLGSTTYVLTDKTGTLTQAKMSVTGFVFADNVLTDTVTWKDDSMIRNLVDVSLGAADAYTEDTGQMHGDTVEQAIVEAARRCSLDTDPNTLRKKRIDFLPFDSERRFAAGLSDRDEYVLCVNGAPELLLEKAVHYHRSDGVVPFTPDIERQFFQAIDAATKEGKRLVATGYKKVSFDDIPDDAGSELLDELVLCGVLILNDPIREDIPEAIAGIQSAGAHVLLITGDNPQTALAIAKMAGIANTDGSALTGDELANMSDEEILEALDYVSVFARVLPRQKMRIAEILQQKGEIVAMTGDGINDAPALRRANIGVAIGSGTEVAKEASDLVLVNDTIATIYAAIEEGRRVIANLRKIVGYLLSTSLSEVVLVGAAILIGAPPPILPAQILWANVIEEGLMSVAFAFEKGEKGAMKRKPQDIHEEGILSREMITFMAVVITILSALTLTLYFYLRSLNIPLEELRSAMFLSVAADSLFMAFAFRSLTTPVWKIPLTTNIFFLLSFMTSAGMLAIVLTIPFFQKVLSYTPLPMFDILLVVGFSVAALVTIELSKWLFFERRDT